MRPFREYIEAREKNRRHFELAYPYATQAFETVTTAFGILGEQLRTGQDREGKTHVSLAPFFLIVVRQTMTAFDALSANQAYAAWAAMRTAIESALIMGKWVDNPDNARIWERRFKDPRAYASTFQGRALRSSSLPNSAAIQRALSHLNDRYLHPNPIYYFRHLSLHDQPSGETVMDLQFFDDDLNVAVGVLGILHLVASVQDGLAEMFANLFVDVARVDIALADLRSKSAEFRRATGSSTPDAEWTLVNIGLWPTET